MSDQRTPDWLIETQNKSWEPEIIISGITLTFVFLLPTHLYNMFAALIQDHGAWDILGRMQYNICLMLLMGLKIILIVHLVLRGFWTGYVGLSYVFPHGVNPDNLPRGVRADQFERPEVFVIRIERVCSLLFSMVFTSLMFVIGFFAMFVPITLLFLTPLDPVQIKNIALFVIVPLGGLGIPILAILLTTVWKDSWVTRKLGTFGLDQSLSIYMSNLGRLRTMLIYGIFFALIVAFTWSSMDEFSFRNRSPVEPVTRPGIVVLKAENYEHLRDDRLRVQRATLDQYRQDGTGMDLFIARYMQDAYTIKKLKESGELREKVGVTGDLEGLWIQDVHEVWIDGEPVSQLNWVYTRHPETGQWGFEARIPLSNLEPGVHTLKLRKWLWEVRKDKLLDLDPWVLIPFAVVKPAG